MALCPDKASTGARPPSDCMKDSCTLRRPSSKPRWKAVLYLAGEQHEMHQVQLSIYSSGLEAVREPKALSRLLPMRSSLYKAWCHSTPHDVWGQVGVCCGGEAARHHLHHLHDLMRKAHLHGERPCLIVWS